MDEDSRPIPQEHGDLEPPNRRPPTAVGTDTPPPPRRRFGLRPQRSFLRPIYVVATSSALGGASAWLAAPWALLRGAGMGALIGGLLSLGFCLYIDFGVAARVTLWRESRWLRRRQRALRRMSRPSA